MIELDGRTFMPASQSPGAEWACVASDRPQPTLTLKDDDLFLIIDTLGNISSRLDDSTVASLGLFCRDTRFLSRLELQIAGRSPVLLSSSATKGFAFSALCTNPLIDDSLPADTLGIHREMVLNGGLFEELTLTNYSTSPVRFELSLSFDADFLDLFEIRGFQRGERGQLLRQVTPTTGVAESDDEPSRFVPSSLPDPAELTLAYQGRDGLLAESHIQFSHQRPHFLKGYTAVWYLALAPHQTAQIGYRLEMRMNGRHVSTVSPPTTLVQAKAAEQMEEHEWQSATTRIRTDNKDINQILERAEQDVYLLRQTFEQGKALSAGVPWFSTLFGRDSIIAAMQTLILDPAIARETLTVLAHYQGKADDDWRDEAPGKILHELRFGELARCQEIPHTPYYGTVDATPLWLLLYADYYAWTHDQATLDRLWPNALAAMDWIDRSCRDTGYLSYNRRSRRGLPNQGWKDSDTCIVDRQGKMAQGAIALCEVQAYVYAAKLRLSDIARLYKRFDLADRWQAEAQDLKTRFNQDFWIKDLDFCALALDGEGRPVDSITSNPGHCLGLGIFDPQRAHSVAERLQAPDLFSGWGIRTLSSLSPAYNPMGYHVGSVWPHDNGLIAVGLRSLGFTNAALEVTQGLLDMTLQQPYCRPPELFCGYERTPGTAPVQYPVACSPQAWATGTVFHLVQLMINPIPNAPGNHLRIIEPALPDSMHQLSLQNLRIGSTLLDLEFERVGSTTACRVVKKRGNLRVVIEA
ncbi:MAG: amylo-alpha-1,6-glucosidase [Cyanobacteria bacterium J069]